MKVYFAGSIRGGRKDQNKYHELILFLSSKVEVLTEHVGDTGIEEIGEQDLSDKEIYQRDLEWLESADAIIAEVTNPSLGVGYELGMAEKLGKPILCLYEESSKKSKLSAMVSGNLKFRTFHYHDLDHAKEEILSFINSLS